MEAVLFFAISDEGISGVIANVIVSASIIQVASI